MSERLLPDRVSEARRVRLVLVLLVVLTVGALWFTTDAAHGLLSGQGAAAVAAAVAFVKARLVALDFMELRGTRAQSLMDAWLALVGTICLVLVLR